MEKEIRYRILNKTSKGVTLKLMGKAMTFPWEEFNKKLIVVDKVWAVLNEEEKKRQKEADEMINWAVVYFLESRAAAEGEKKLNTMYQLGVLITEISKKLECSNLDAMKLIRDRAMLLNPYLLNPIGSEGKKKEHKQVKESSTPATNEKKPTLGDAFPGLSKLKDSMEDK